MIFSYIKNVLLLSFIQHSFSRFSNFDQDLCQLQRFNRDFTRAPDDQQTLLNQPHSLNKAPPPRVLCQLTGAPAVIRLKTNTSLVQIFPDSFSSDRAPYMQFRLEGKGPVEVEANVNCRQEKIRTLPKHIFRVYQCLNLYHQTVLKANKEHVLPCVDSYMSKTANYTWTLTVGSDHEIDTSGSGITFTSFNRSSEGLYACHMREDNPSYLSIVSRYHIREMSKPNPVSKVSSSDWWTFGNDTNIQLQWMDKNGMLEGGLLHTNIQWKSLQTGDSGELKHEHPTGLVKFTFQGILSNEHSYIVSLTPVTPYGPAETYHHFVPSFSLSQNKVDDVRRVP